MGQPSFVLGELVGWRVWEIKRPLAFPPVLQEQVPTHLVNNYFLNSLIYNMLWFPDAKVVAEGNIAPGNAGIHSYKKVEGCSEWTESDCSCVHPLAVGSIEMWGEVIEHEFGYRARYARIMSIDYVVDKHKRNTELLQALQSFYRVREHDKSGD
jgi:hypothetical protein